MYPPKEVMLKAMTTRQIWEFYALGPFTDENRVELIRDLADRGEITPEVRNQLLGITPIISDTDDGDDTQQEEEENLEALPTVGLGANGQLVPHG